MGICEVVVQMADAVACARQPLTQQEKDWIDQLRTITDYCERKRLDLWESACKAAAGAATDSATSELLSEIQMLGQCNLYQRFNESRTRAFYERLIPFFAQHGVHIPPAPDLATW